MTASDNSVLYQILITLALMYLLILAAPKLGLLDTPGGRKNHQGIIPTVGGIAIFISIVLTTYLLNTAILTRSLLLVAAIPFILGVIDDRIHLRPNLRLALQYLCGILLAIYGGILIKDVGNILGVGHIPLLELAIPLTALAAAGLSNAYNMIDGIDGLAGSLIALPIGILWLLAVQAKHPMAPALLVVLIPVLVFLCFNLSPIPKLLPKVFLGDGGSITLGFIVTACLIYFSQGPNRLIQPVTALWLVTLPLMDMLATMLRRIKHNKHPMQADQSHVHHILQHMGYSPKLSLMILLAYAIGCAVIGLALEHTTEYLSLGIYCLLFAAHCAGVIQAFKIDRVQQKANA
ncbi:MAG: hypothetical protein V7744_19720 [Pseudomonadales bacterium]